MADSTDSKVILAPEAASPVVSPSALMIALEQGNWDMAASLLDMDWKWDVSEKGAKGSLLEAALKSAKTDSRFQRGGVASGNDRAGIVERLFALGVSPFEVWGADSQRGYSYSYSSSIYGGRRDSSPMAMAYHLGLFGVIRGVVGDSEDRKKAVLTGILTSERDGGRSAVEAGSIERVSLLLFLGLNPNEPQWVEKGVLMPGAARDAAAFCGSLLPMARTPEMADFLLKNGASPVLAGWHGKTPIEAFSGMANLMAKDRNAMLQLVMTAKDAIKRAGSPGASKKRGMPTEDEKRALFAAASKGVKSSLTKQLGGFAKEAAQIRDENGATLLMASLSGGRFDTARHLMESRGLSLEDADNSGTPAFVWGLYGYEWNVKGKKRFVEGRAWLMSEVLSQGMDKRWNLSCEALGGDLAREAAAKNGLGHDKALAREVLAWITANSDPTKPGRVRDGKAMACAVEAALDAGHAAARDAEMMMSLPGPKASMVDSKGESLRARILGYSTGWSSGDYGWDRTLNDMSAPGVIPGEESLLVPEAATFLVSFGKGLGVRSKKVYSWSKSDGNVSAHLSKAFDVLCKSGGVALADEDKNGVPAFDLISGAFDYAAASERHGDSRFFTDLAVNWAQDERRVEDAGMILAGILGSKDAGLVLEGLSALRRLNANGCLRLPFKSKAWTSEVLQGALEGHRGVNGVTDTRVLLETAVMESSKKAAPVGFKSV